MRLFLCVSVRGGSCTTRSSVISAILATDAVRDENTLLGRRGFVGLLEAEGFVCVDGSLLFLCRARAMSGVQECRRVQFDRGQHILRRLVALFGPKHQKTHSSTQVASQEK